jgi:hypothetical protein
MRIGRNGACFRDVVRPRTTVSTVGVAGRES